LLPQTHYDIVIVGAGRAGLSLARQLLLQTGKTVLLIDRKKDPSKGHQKVGESLVQLSGYYFSKVLDLEEYLLRNHYLKFTRTSIFTAGNTSSGPSWCGEARRRRRAGVQTTGRRT
jgi:choline dehydrogenase-like flavoprotein